MSKPVEWTSSKNCTQFKPNRIMGKIKIRMAVVCHVCEIQNCFFLLLLLAFWLLLVMIVVYFSRFFLLSLHVLLPCDLTQSASSFSCQYTPYYTMRISCDRIQNVIQNTITQMYVVHSSHINNNTENTEQAVQFWCEPNNMHFGRIRAITAQTTNSHVSLLLVPPQQHIFRFRTPCVSLWICVLFRYSSLGRSHLRCFLDIFVGYLAKLKVRSINANFTV